MSTRDIDVSGPRLRIIRVALDHWSNALKRVSSRVQGMGYPAPAVQMRADRALIEGDDQNQGLLERLRPQANLLEEEDEVPEEPGQVPLSHDELRIAYYAVRKHRERILDLKRKNEKEEYDAEEQERDLEIIGEPRGDDGSAATGMLGALDLGWEEAPADPDQLELTAASGSPPAAGDEGPDGPVEADQEILYYVRERLEEDPDAENKTLKAECEEEFPDAGIGSLSLRQFHARYPLQVKRAMAQDG